MKLLKHMNQPQPGSMLSVVYVVSKIVFILNVTVIKVCVDEELSIARLYNHNVKYEKTFFLCIGIRLRRHECN